MIHIVKQIKILHKENPSKQEMSLNKEPDIQSDDIINTAEGKWWHH